MNNKKFEFLFKMIIIVSILFIAFSFIAPLTNLSVENSDQNMNMIDYYSWGFKLNMAFDSMPEDFATVNSYFPFTFDEAFSIFVGGDNIIFQLMLVLILPIVIFSVIFAIAGLYDLSKHGLGYEKYPLILSGFFSIISVIIIYLFSTFGMPSNVINDSYSVSVTNIIFTLGPGSYLLILSTILLFSVFTVSTYFFPLDNEKDEFYSNQELLAKLKSRYVNGEIGKEEFEQIKKDIEGENE